MKKYCQINNWIVKEKRLDEIPNFIEDNKKYIVFAPDGRCMEDNLTIEKAKEFCNNNLDFIKVR